MTESSNDEGKYRISVNPNPVGSTSESISDFLSRTRNIQVDPTDRTPLKTGVFSEDFDPKEYQRKTALLNGGIRIPYKRVCWTIPFLDPKKGNEKGKRPPTPVEHSLFSDLEKGITHNVPSGDC